VTQLTNEWLDRWITERILKLAYDLEMDLVTKDKRAEHLERIEKLLQARDLLREKQIEERDGTTKSKSSG
jgi:hypothetical protein